VTAEEPMHAFEQRQQICSRLDIRLGFAALLGQHLDHQSGRGFGARAGQWPVLLHVLGPQLRRRQAAEHDPQQHAQHATHRAVHAQLQHDHIERADDLLSRLLALGTQYGGLLGQVGDALVADVVQTDVEHFEQHILAKTSGNLGALD